MLNELNLDAGIKVGADVVVVSRLDETKVWNGTVTAVDHNNTQMNTYDELYGSYDSLTSSTNYPFYVSLETTEGLLLGQHVYVRLAGVNEKAESRVLLPESYLMGVYYDEQTLITSAQVWTIDNEYKLIKTKVILGEFLMDQGCYVILSGLSLDDFVADPANPGCVEGASADLRSEDDFNQKTEPTEEPSEESTGTAPVETTEPAAETEAATAPGKTNEVEEPA